MGPEKEVTSTGNIFKDPRLARKEKKEEWGGPNADRKERLPSLSQGKRERSGQRRRAQSEYWVAGEGGERGREGERISLSDRAGGIPKRKVKRKATITRFANKGSLPPIQLGRKKRGKERGKRRENLRIRVAMNDLLHILSKKGDVPETHRGKTAPLKEKRGEKMQGD